MADFLADLIDKTDDDIFDKFFTDKTAIKFVIEDKLRKVRKSNEKVFESIGRKNIVNNYKYLSLELDKEDVRTNPYKGRFYKDFPLLGTDKPFDTLFFKTLEENKGKINLSIKDVFELMYPNNDEVSYNNSFKFSEVAKLAHFITNGQSPLYNATIRELFCLENLYGKNDLTKDDKFFEQVEFVNEIYQHILKSSQTKIKGTYDFSEVIEKFREYFYVSPTEYSDIKIIDTLIWNQQ